MTKTIYTSRSNAIEFEIIDAIEASGIDIASRNEYDIDAIASEVLGDYAEGYALKVDTETFWTIVADCEVSK